MSARFGTVAVVGAPNAGKSTLVNALVGQKVAIVTPKAQTTRTRLMGIAIAGEAQLLLTDTPGIFEPKRRLDRAMVAAAWGSAGEGGARRSWMRCMTERSNERLPIHAAHGTDLTARSW
ncbi:MAG TPA: GTPase, partial [Allosphingosinicella sp.]|nr:GTPase [Allosphingosinicella sp.]